MGEAIGGWESAGFVGVIRRNGREIPFAITDDYHKVDEIPADAMARLGLKAGDPILIRSRVEVERAPEAAAQSSPEGRRINFGEFLGSAG